MMNKYRKKIQLLELIKKSFIVIYKATDDADLEDKRFEEWSMRDIYAHLSGWHELRSCELENFLKGAQVEYVSEYDAFNEASILKRSHMNNEQILNDFAHFFELMISSYKKLNEDQINQKIVLTKKVHKTPIIWIDTDVKHCTNHLKQLTDSFK